MKKCLKYVKSHLNRLLERFDLLFVFSSCPVDDRPHKLYIYTIAWRARESNHLLHELHAFLEFRTLWIWSLWRHRHQTIEFGGGGVKVYRVRRRGRDEGCWGSNGSFDRNASMMMTTFVWMLLLSIIDPNLTQPFPVLFFSSGWLLCVCVCLWFSSLMHCQAPI